MPHLLILCIHSIFHCTQHILQNGKHITVYLKLKKFLNTIPYFHPKLQIKNINFPKVCINGKKKNCKLHEVIDYSSNGDIDIRNII